MLMLQRLDDIVIPAVHCGLTFSAPPPTPALLIALFGWGTYVLTQLSIVKDKPSHLSAEVEVNR